MRIDAALLLAKHSCYSLQPTGDQVKAAARELTANYRKELQRPIRPDYVLKWYTRLLTHGHVCDAARPGRPHKVPNADAQLAAAIIKRGRQGQVRVADVFHARRSLYNAASTLALQLCNAWCFSAALLLCCRLWCQMLTASQSCKHAETSMSLFRRPSTAARKFVASAAATVAQ
jgi:hypothetical protein